MDLTLAFDLNQEQYLIRHFRPGQDCIDSIIEKNTEDENDNSLISKSNIIFSESDDNLAIPFCAIKVSPAELHLTPEVVKNMVYDDAKNLSAKITEENSIKENLELIENISPESERISKIFLENREVFILNLWKIIFKNLSTYELRVLFQTIDNKDDKKLSIKTLCSSDFSDIQESSDEEKLLFQDLESEFGKPINIVSYDKKTGELTMTSTIKTSKIIIMAKVHHFSILQQTVLKGLANSFEHNLAKK